MSKNYFSGCQRTYDTIGHTFGYDYTLDKRVQEYILEYYSLS